MKKSMLVMAMVIALTMSTMATAFANGSANRATGDVEFVTGYADANSSLNLGTTTASFNAHAEVLMDNGKTRPVKGQVEVTNHDGVSFTGSVTEVLDYSDGMFMFCGTIDRFEGESVTGQGTNSFVMNVIDADEGDSIGIKRSDADACDESVNAARPLIDGNLVVHYNPATAGAE